jgi:anthranilate/para-aminobenzoate synthase component I
MDSVKRWHSLPAEVYALVERTPGTVLLESAKPAAAQPAPEPQNESRSRLFVVPLRVYAVTEPAELPPLFAEIESAVANGHYAAGFFAYECGNCFEPKAAMRATEDGQPVAWIGLYERCYLFDHRTGAFLGADPPGLQKLAPNADSAKSQEPPGAVFSLSAEEYGERIAAIHEWIRSGDVYQLNFTAPFEVTTPTSPAELYPRLALVPSQWITEHFCTGSRAGTFSASLPSSSSRWKDAEPPGASQRGP